MLFGHAWRLCNINTLVANQLCSLNTSQTSRLLTPDRAILISSSPADFRYGLSRSKGGEAQSSKCGPLKCSRIFRLLFYYQSVLLPTDRFCTNSDSSNYDDQRFIADVVSASTEPLSLPVPLVLWQDSFFYIKEVFLTWVSVQKTIDIKSSRPWYKITAEVHQQSGEKYRGRPGVRFREWVFKPWSSNLNSEFPNSEMSKSFRFQYNFFSWKYAHSRCTRSWNLPSQTGRIWTFEPFWH